MSLEESPELSFDNVIVVTNLPAGVPPEKQPKLHTFLTKVISSDPSADIIDVHFATDEATSATLGVAIVTLSDASKVQPVLDRVEGFEISKGQPLRAFPFEVAESIIEDAINNTNSSGGPDSSDSISLINRSSYRNWQIEEPRMEQLLTRYEDETEINWIDPLDPEPSLYYGGEREKVNGKKWCDSNVEMSPNGTFLVTYHSPGLALWGGNHFASKTRFEHSHVAGAIFSPNEEYLVTYRHPLSQTDKEVVKVWRVLNGELLRTFPYTAGVLSTDFNECGFLWSSSSTYLSRVVHGAVFVYETPSMKLLTDARTGQPAPFKFHSNVKVMSWAPAAETAKDDMLAVWLPEGPNEPASLLVLDVVTRREITAKKLFNAGDAPAEFHWHPEGDYIVLKASRMLTRSKKTGKVVVELIRMREPGCPSESLTTFGTNVVSFAWESGKGTARLAMICEDEKKSPPGVTPTAALAPTKEYKLKIHTIAPGKPVEEPLANHTLALANSTWNSVVWSPIGQYFVLYQGPVSSKPGHVEISEFAPDRKNASTGNPNGELVFYSCTAMGGIELLRKEEHVNVNSVQYDPSGRFVLTAVLLNIHEKNSPSYKLEQYSGYNLWTFQGRNLKKVDGVRLWNVQWRPHVQQILSLKEKKAAVKNLKEKGVVYDEEDRVIRDAKKNSAASGLQSKQSVFDEEMDSIDSTFADRMAERPGWEELYNTHKTIASAA
jgi:translation initiation factor 3 subunit B